MSSISTFESQERYLLKTNMKDDKETICLISSIHLTKTSFEASKEIKRESDIDRICTDWQMKHWQIDTKYHKHMQHEFPFLWCHCMLFMHKYRLLKRFRRNDHHWSIRRPVYLLQKKHVESRIVSSWLDMDYTIRPWAANGVQTHFTNMLAMKGKQNYCRIRMIETITRNLTKQFVNDLQKLFNDKRVLHDLLQLLLEFF